MAFFFELREPQSLATCIIIREKGSTRVCILGGLSVSTVQVVAWDNAGAHMPAWVRFLLFFFSPQPLRFGSGEDRCKYRAGTGIGRYTEWKLLS